MKKIITVLLIIIINTSFLFFIINNSIPSGTPYDNPHIIKKITKNLFPEGWGFFTRDAREDNFSYYKKENLNFEKKTKPCSSAKYNFGLNRDCRAKSAELELLVKQIPDSLWRKKDMSFLSKLNLLPRENRIDTITNQFHYPRIEGNIILVKQERLPWAWSRNRKNLNIPIKYINIYVKRNKRQLQ